MGIALSLHLLATVIWVGGLFFAFMCLRPAAADKLTAEHRLPLWQSVFDRFFPWVWGAIATLLVTGIGMIMILGGMGAVGIHVHMMLLLGIFMMLLFLHIVFNPYKKLKVAVANQDWEAGAVALDKIRKFVRMNLIIGLSVVVIAGAGQYL